MTWIKICGITNLEDALAAVEAGVDALGFVFYEKSPRYIEPKSAGAIVSQLPASVEKVGVFVNQLEDPICEIADEAGLTGVQFHGTDEDPRVADLVVKRRPEVKVLVAIPMLRPEPEGWAMMWAPDSVYAFLADSGGGTGKTFDWRTSRDSVRVMSTLSRVAIAGGLNPHNVSLAIQLLDPWGVDVSSGVEKSPGKKDSEKIRAFVAAVRSAERVQ
jgi:phosphoribosylanthranilate isomerase